MRLPSRMRFSERTTVNQKKLFFNLRKAKSKISALEEGDLRPDQVKLIACRRADHAQGTSRRVRHLARARAPNKRVCLREGAEVGKEARRCDGNSGASAGATHEAIMARTYLKIV